MNNIDNASLKFSRLTYILIWSLLIINMLELSSHNILHQVGKFSIMASLLFFFCLFLYYISHCAYNTNKLFHLYLFTGGYFIIYIITFFISDENNSLLYLFGLLSVLSFIIISTQNYWDHRYFKLFGHISSILIWSLFINWLFIDPTFEGYRGLFRNPNGLAIILFCILYIQLLSFNYSSYLGRIYFGSLLSMNLFLIITTNSRSVFLSLFIVLLSMLLLLLKKKVFSHLFLIAIVFNILFFLIYVLLENTIFGKLLNTISLEVLDKSFYSGRSTIWSQLMPYIYEKPLIGHGISFDASDFTSPPFTAHNQYIQILLESGFIGIILFILLLFSIWKLLLRNLTTFEAKLSASFFIATLVYMNFELTLFQNNYAIGLMQWLVITLGVNINSVENSTYSKRKSNTQALRRSK